MSEPGVRLRRIPYPYRAMLAICSDLDETPDRHVYAETMRFLNTTESTSIGPGLGLEVGNTIYFDMAPDQFAYWNTDDTGRVMVQTLIGSGHIDCLHSFGDLATTREHAVRTLDELTQHDCRLEVWIDHAVAPTNFGADIMQGHGDERGHAAYHADLTAAFGVRYVWRGRVTSVIGQDVPASLRGIWTARHPVASGRTVAKEAAKHVLGRRGHGRYGPHGANDLLWPVTLRDGTAVYEFLRSNPHWGGVSSCETARGIGQVLTDAMLDRLVSREAPCILYTHLGKIHTRSTPFTEEALAGWRRLARRAHDHSILVTTTQRVLRYAAVRRQLRFEVHQDGECVDILLTGLIDPAGGLRMPKQEDLAGITFEFSRRQQAWLRLASGEPVEHETTHRGGATIVSVPWRRLEFPQW